MYCNHGVSSSCATAYACLITRLLLVIHITAGTTEETVRTEAHQVLFMQQRARWLPSCANSSVMERSTGEFSSSGWSVGADTYNHPDLPVCKSSSELLASLKQGHRVQIEDANYFEPAGCTFEWYSQDMTCDILSRYSTMHIVGDSISRHHQQAMLMLLTQDWKFGALPRLSPQPELYETCTCDGQFSEHQICRTYSGSITTLSSSHAYGICSDHRRFAMYRRDAYTLGESQICSEDSRPQLLLLQGGVHLHSNSSTMIDRLDAVFADLSRKVKECLGSDEVNIHVVWTGLNTQSKDLDLQFPHQAAGSAFAFNQDIEHFLLTHHRHWAVTILDFLPLTADAPSSDGYHFLSDVNLVKAMYLFNLMDFLTPSASGLTSPE